MNWKPWLSLVLIFWPYGASGQQTLRVATWNIENFWHIAGESLRGPYRGRDTIRYDGDYAALRATIARLDADVWALQEIGSPAAAQHLFPHLIGNWCFPIAICQVHQMLNETFIRPWPSAKALICALPRPLP